MFGNFWLRSVDIFGEAVDVVVVVVDSDDIHFDVSLDDDVDAYDNIFDNVVGVVVVVAVVSVGAKDKIFANVVDGADADVALVDADDDVDFDIIVETGDNRTIFLTSLAIRSTTSILDRILSASRRPLSRAPSIWKTKNSPEISWMHTHLKYSLGLNRGDQ